MSMASPRARLLVATLVITDAAWLFAACAIVGFFAGQEGSPLHWAAVLGLVGAGTLTASYLAPIPVSRRTLLAAHGVLCGFATYVALAVSQVAGRPGFDPAWPATVINGEVGARALAGLVLAILMSAALWYRGVVIAGAASPHGRLLFGFRVGLVMFMLALLLEQASGRDLHTGAMLVAFFGASLAGLAASRVPAGTRLPAAWIRTVCTCIVAVIGLGLALGATASVFGGSGVDLVLTAWGYLSGALVWVVRSLLGAVASMLTGLLAWLRDAGIIEPSAGAAEGSPAGDAGLRDLQPGDVIGDAVADVLQVAVLCLMVYVFVRMLVYAYRQLPHYGELALPEEHEFIGAKADPLADIATLLRQVLPGRGERIVPALRADRARLAPGIAEVFELYFELIAEAVLRGHEFAAARTPNERAAALAAALPGAPVDAITRRFNAACYGDEPTDAATVAALRRELEIASHRRAPRPPTDAR